MDHEDEIDDATDMNLRDAALYFSLFLTLYDKNLTLTEQKYNIPDDFDENFKKIIEKSLDELQSVDLEELSGSLGIERIHNNDDVVEAVLEIFEHSR